MASGTIKNITAEIANQTPETIYRPISENQYSDWTYTVPYSGILYLCVNSTTRSYVTVKLNNNLIGVTALGNYNPSQSVTLPVIVTKGDTVTVINLTADCFLVAGVTALMAFPLQP